MSRRPDDTLFDIIAVGGRVFDLNHRMPAWGQTLDSSEIRTLVEFIRQLCQCQGPECNDDCTSNSVGNVNPINSQILRGTRRPGLPDRFRESLLLAAIVYCRLTAPEYD